MLNKFSTFVLQQVINANAHVEDKSITTEFLAQLVATHTPAIKATFEGAGFANCFSKIQSYHEFVEKSKRDLQILKQVLTQFYYTEERFEKSVKGVDGSWRTLSVEDISIYFRLTPKEKSRRLIAPLPANLLNSYKWLYILRNSALFTSIWKSQSGQFSNLLEVSTYWRQLILDLISEESLFGTLEQYHQHLSVPSELKLLLRTGLGFKINEGVPVWQGEKLDQSLYDIIHPKILRWNHLSSVYKSQNDIQRVLSSIQVFLSVKAIEESNVKKNQLRILNELLSPQEWNTIPLRDLNKYTDYAFQIHPCLLRMNAELFEITSNSLDLFRWLREMQNDADFTSSVEMAMGKTEMECPAELWQEEPGKPGRPDEEKLSMISSVRSYLHGIIYRVDEKLNSYDEIIAILDNLRESDPLQLIDSLKACNEYSLPLMELLNSDSENAPEKLSQLFIPNRNTTWVCSNSQNDLDFLKSLHKNVESTYGGQLWLQWVVPRKGGVIQKALNLNELMDFQSSIVLSKTDDRSAGTQSLIEKFIIQLGWMKELFENISVLFNNGNFDYQSFSLHISIDSDPNIIRDLATKTKEISDIWGKDIERAKEENYYLNFFGIKQLWNLVKCLKFDRESEGAISSFRSLIQMVQPSQSFDPDVITHFIQSITSGWDANYEESFTGRQILDLLGKILHSSLVTLPIARRILREEGNEQILPSGVHIIVSESSSGVTDHILSIYYRYGYLPENEDIYMCKKSTTWEELHNIVNRWKKSHLNNRSNRIYCIGYTHLLNFELQHKLVSRLKSVETFANNPLLLVSHGIDNQYIVSQYSHKRVNFNPLPSNVLITIGEFISDIYSRGISVYASRHAGAGKTFQIRTTAYNEMLHYIHFPIYGNSRVIERIVDATKDFLNDEVLLHIDLADSVPDDINSFLFDLIYLGNVLDPISGHHYCWNPQLTSICIELACGNLLPRMRICELLKLKHVTVTEKTLCVSYEELIAGMGEEFDSPRCDGTRLRKESDNELLANAFQRLQYVCLALDMMNKNGGKFPYVYEGADSLPLENLRMSLSKSQNIRALQTTDISPGRCFELLMEAIKLDRTKPSLWCLWNFVNVFYWQLRDMHYPDSPINCACMPDEGSEKATDSDLKARIKGEVVSFLIRTAREFATRQIKKEDPNMIVGLYVTGLSRAEWNGFWPRTEFDNDNEPCFHYNSTFYIYYRSAESRWVVDDVLEPYGASFSASVSDSINSEWKTCSTWERDHTIRVRKINTPNGYLGQGLSITGPPNKAGSIGETEYGEYHRLPQYDDIAGRAHYVLIKGETRRHVFWSDRENTWQICPVCNNDEGAYGLSVSSDIEGTWRFMPPDKVEKNVSMKMVTLHEKRSNSYRSVGYRGGMYVAEENYEEDDDDLEKLMDNLLMWNESNHECLLFSNEHHVVSFLSMQPAKMRAKMHPRLLEHLKENKINVGEDLNTVNAKFHEILGSLTGVYLSLDQASKIMGGNYCLTGDSLLKMLAIFVRSRCGVPVVLMGECGCGKTMLIKYLCAWMGVKLFILDVHGGTTEQDIFNIMAKAEAAVANGEVKESYVFLDEINTCAHMGLLCEVICQRSLYGKRISEDVKVLAALNPYRKRPDIGNIPGLVFQLHGSNTPDPMAHLVYRVHPIPRTLRDFIFDFGSLSYEMEKLYIYSMISKRFKSEGTPIHNLMTEIVLACQNYIRDIEKEPSSTSLRDVERCLELTDWFIDKVVKKKSTSLSALACSFVLGISFVYFYRLNTKETRDGLWKTINGMDVNWKARGIKAKGFDPLANRGGFEKVINSLQEGFCKNVILEDGIAMNQALMENLFVTIICILNRIPIFVVGKPGSSKTLTMQVIASNLQGKQSPIAFWRKFPAVYIFQYQCSPMSDSHSIQHQFDMAVRYQQHAENTITVLLLDEVGLAEHSPDMPLKVLHGMLVKPPIAIVGLSNWTLDPAKMNRAICLQRTDPSPSDIHLTGSRIVSSEENSLNIWLEPLAKSYHDIYTTQKGREFIGMRDYYSLIKYLKKTLDTEKCTLDVNILTTALCRNFGGKPEIMTRIQCTFHTNCFNLSAPEVLPPCKILLLANLQDRAARHVMVLTKNGAALPLMFGADILDPCETVVLVGSEFKDDKTELHLVQQINEVKLAMASGKTLVLLNHDNIYEALYDVLNQRYLFKKDKAGVTRRMLRLAIGSRSQLCTVADSFKIVVIVEQDHAYRNLDLPLLNRFEKQVFCATDVLTTAQWILVEEIKEWVDQVFCEITSDGLHSLFCGYHASTIASVVLYETKFSDNEINEGTIERIKQHLLRISLPVAVIQSNTLRSLKNVDYFAEQCDFKTVMEKFIFNSNTTGVCSTMLTYSPVTHLDASFNSSISVILLSQLSSEKDLILRLKSFFSSEEKESSLVVQCDPISCNQSLINHAQHICVQQKNILEASGALIGKSKNIVFIIHLPPGISSRLRHFSMDFNLPWKYYFIDDLRIVTGLSLTDMIHNSLHSLSINGKFDIRSVINAKFQNALSFCLTPDIGEFNAASFKDRIGRFRTIFGIPEFQNYVVDLINLIFATHDKNPDTGYYYHVDAASSLSLGGSLRQNLFSSIELLTIQALAHVIRFLDRDFAITLLMNYENVSKLWYEILNNPTIFDRNAFAFLSKIGSIDMIPETIYNYGKYIPLTARFPHSYAVVKILDSVEAKKILEEGEEKDRFDRCESTLPLLFGEKLVSLMNEFGDGEHLQYLHDYVTITASPLANLSFDVLVYLYEIVIRSTRKDCLSNIAKIHAASWMNEERLYLYSSILSSAPFATDNLIALLKSETDMLDYTISAQDRLKVLDSAFLASILDSFWQLLSGGHYFTFLSQFAQTLKDIESIIHILTPYENTPMWKDTPLISYRLSVVGLLVARIFIQEIALPSGRNIESIISDLRFCEPGKVSYLTTILAKLTSSDLDSQFIRKFFNRYCQEIIFGEQEGFLNFGFTHVIESDLVNTLNQIINGSIPAKFDASYIDVTSRRLALYCSLRSSSRLTSPIEITTPQGLLLYLQNFEDKHSEVDSFDLELENSDIEKVTLKVEEAVASNILGDYLCSLAKCKQVIMKFVREASMTPKLFDSMIPPALRILINKQQNEIVTYILKVMQFYGGIDLLSEVLYLPPNQNSWIPYDRSQLAKNEQLADPFIWFGEQYDRNVSLLRKAGSRNSKLPELETLMEKKHDLSLGTLFASIYSELLGNKENHSIKGFACTSDSILSKLLGEGSFQLFSWILTNPKPWKGVPNMQTDVYETKLKLQVIAHLLVVTLEKPCSWLYSLLLSPSSHHVYFLPSIPDDEFLEIVKASGYVGWYKCPNGHPYSVGNCTYPMEKARCLHPGCGAPIGGENHVCVKGVTRLGEQDLHGEDKRGYDLPNPESSARISNLPNRILRFFIHSILLTGLLSLDDKQQALWFLSPKNPKTALNSMNSMWTRLNADWEAIKKSLYLGDTDTNIVLHLVLREVIDMNLVQPYFNRDERATFERSFTEIVKKVCGQQTDMRLAINHAKAELKDTGRSTSVKKSLEPSGMWEAMNEANLNPTIEDLLWRIRLPVSYDYFTDNFALSVENTTNHPILDDFLKEEEKLPLIKYIADVLVWHGILYEVISNNSITRDEAATITNADILDKISPNKRNFARNALTKYCIAFNTVLPKVERIFECQDNPYLTKDGQVDLSGTKSSASGMQDATPIIYSLPSMLQGEADVPGLCTIQIINFLQNSHNQLLRKFSTVENLPANTPAINYLTSYEVINKKIISYDREEHLIPLIRSYAIQPLEYGEGATLTFDFKSIERSLINGLISNKMPLVVQIRHFNYRGDIQKSGRLQNLRTKVPQQNINIYTQNTILSEIDTLHQLNKLMSQLEVSINFLTSFSSNVGIDPEQSWEDFVKNSLMFDSSIWDDVTTPTISQQIQLQHLQSLYLCLEEKMKGNPLDNVLFKYRENLIESDEVLLRTGGNLMKLDILLPVIREFMVEELSDEGRWKETENLKMFLTFAGEKSNVDLEVDWFEDNFPEGLELRHCYQSYQFLSALANY